MKNTNNTRFLKPSAILVLFLFTIATMGSDKNPAYMELSTWKYSDNSRSFIATITSEDSLGNEIPAVGAAVNFYITTGDDQELAGSVETDKKGIAKISFPDNYNFPKNEEAYIEVFAKVENDAHFEDSEAELTFKDVVINFSFEENDGVKQIYFEGIIKGYQNDTLPLADDDIYFFVPRMFNNLEIAAGWFEEEGNGYVDFPVDIIGDTLGNIKVIAKISEHYDYGNVIKEAEINWAIPRHMAHKEGPNRALWTPIAPLWMIITLIIMLVGVWGHYFYAVFELYKIKKIGKENKT